PPPSPHPFPYTTLFRSKLKGEGRFDESKTLGHYLPMARGTNKENLLYSDILTHQARLQSWIPFWKETVRRNGSFRWFTMKEDSRSEEHTSELQSRENLV